MRKLSISDEEFAIQWNSGTPAEEIAKPFGVSHWAVYGRASDLSLPRRHFDAEKASNWNGGRSTHSEGYILVSMPNHPRQHRGYVYEHVVVAEKALGRFLPLSARVHHVNKIKGDNRSENLLICEDEAYHRLIHKRLRILEAGGDPKIHKLCGRCGRLKLISQFYRVNRNADGLAYACKSCLDKYRLTFYRKKIGTHVPAA